MIGERGPEEKRHLPAYNGGCYRGRIDDCCWLCTGRIIVGHLRGFLRIGTRHAATQTHELIGKDVEIPIVHRNGEEAHVEHVTGRITEVFDLGDEPDVFAVQLENGDRFALSVKHLG